jgi:hypothetical protein
MVAARTYHANQIMEKNMKRFSFGPSSIPQNRRGVAMLNKLFVSVMIIGLAASAFAQRPTDMRGGPISSLQKGGPFNAATTACQSTYSSGIGLTFMQFCVTENGNITNFVAPSGFSQLFPGEGYGICDATSSFVAYYDEAIYGDSGNWLTSVITQPGGPNTFPLTITRTTSDGVWTLTQSFTRNTTERLVKVVQSLKNNTAITRSAYFTRYADVDADGSAGNDYFDNSTFSVWGYEWFSGGGGTNHGLLLSATPSVFSLSGYVAKTGGSNPCSANLNGSSPAQIDGALLYYWFATFPAHGSKKFTFEYRPI